MERNKADSTTVFLIYLTVCRDYRRPAAIRQGNVGHHDSPEIGLQWFLNNDLILQCRLTSSYNPILHFHHIPCFQ